MSILVNRDTRLLVQGITGRAGEFHSSRMLDYGTSVVAGVTPGKGGQHACEGRVPVFDSVQQAVAETGANTSAVYVPARWAADAIIEAADAGLSLIVCITEHIPVHDMIRVSAHEQFVVNTNLIRSSKRVWDRRSRPIRRLAIHDRPLFRARR